MKYKHVIWLVAAIVAGCATDNGGSAGNTSGGSTTVSCRPGNCAGCCTGNLCVGGTSSLACGSGGGTCGYCSSPNICLSGGYCGIDPESVWLVQPSQGTIASTNNGASWDSLDGSPPDVIVTTTCPPSSNPSTKKSSQAESYTPAWNDGGCTSKAKDLLAEPFLFRLDDNDPVGADSITENLSVQLGAADFASGHVSLGASGGMQGITFDLTKM
jgi:hypothetical protein